MAQESFATVLEQRDRWLTQQILDLSVTLLSQGIFTCTACGEIEGDYIIQQGKTTQRLNSAETYGLLQFLLSQDVSV